MWGVGGAMSRWGKRMPRDFDVDDYMRKVHGVEKSRVDSAVNHYVPRETSRETAALERPLFDEFVELCAAHGLARPVKEYVFHPVRKWRFDYAWVVNRVAIEMDGGIWREDRGAHGRPANILRDMEKLNAAVIFGWRVLRYTPEGMKNDAVRDVKALFAEQQ